MATSSTDAQAHLGITQSGGGWSFTDIAHLTLDVVGMVPVVGNAADGINAAWYAAEGKWLDAALSSIALIPGIGQAVTMAKPAIKAAASGMIFKNLDEALQWAKRWLDEAGILARGSDEAGAAGRSVDQAAGGEFVDDAIGQAPIPNHLSVAQQSSSPAGWTSRVADNGKGTVVQRPGAAGNADMVRIMEATDRYPNGYARFYNSHGQPIDLAGKPGPRSATHIPIGPDGSLALPTGWSQ